VIVHGKCGVTNTVLKVCDTLKIAYNIKTGFCYVYKSNYIIISAAAYNTFGVDGRFS